MTYSEERNPTTRWTGAAVVYPASLSVLPLTFVIAPPGQRDRWAEQISIGERRILMRRILVSLLLLLLGVALGAAAATMWVQKKPAPPPQQTNANNVTPDLPIFAYCELATNRDKYDGQLVRVGTRLIGFIHGIEFYDPNCPGDTQAAVVFDPQHKDEIERVLKHARGSDNWLEPADIIAVGRFNKVTPSGESDAIYSTASLRFTIVRIEKASKVR